MGFEAGADIVTVLGMAHEVTVAAVVEQARRYRSPGAPQELERIRVRLRKAQMAVAGGITLDTVETVGRFHPDIVVVGAGIMKCVDKRSAASSFRRVLDKMEER